MKKLYLLIIVVAALAGCNSDDQGPSSMRKRQDAALADPMNYNGDVDRTDISGGGLMQFKKDAFKKDVDSVFSP